MPGKTLLAFAADGTKSETIVAVASVFAVRGFTHIALISPDSDQLAKDEDQVLDAIQERGYSCQTRTITCDLKDAEAFKKVIAEVDGWGELEGCFWDGTGGDMESMKQALNALVQEIAPGLQHAGGKDGRSPAVIVAGASLPLDDATSDGAGDRVHIALVKTDQPSPEKVADAAWEVYKQPKSQWSGETSI